MADRDLDQYLEGLGIDVHEEEKPKGDDLLGTPQGDDAEYEDAAFDDGLEGDEGLEGDDGADLGDDDGQRQGDPYDQPEFDMEAALAPGGAYGIIPDDLSPAERAESFLVNVLLNLDPTYSVEVVERHEEIHAEIFGGDSGRVIGKGGRTLAALEFLTNAVVNRTEGESTRVVLDVGGYKRRRDDRLRQTALKAAARVRKSGYAVELEPMSAAERRVVHMAIADESQVMSESTGDGRARRVVVKPIE
jgi:spoIIIJ-associated protein